MEQEKVTQPLQKQESRSLGQFEDIFRSPSGVMSEFSQTDSLPALISNEFHSNTISEAPFPPPLPPPPPPPLPTKEEYTQCSEKSISPVKQSNTEKPAPLITIAPSAHFFDSSELVSAKKKLKKTGDIEGLQRRRGNF